MARRREPDIDRRLLDAARRLLSTIGYDAITMEGVAAEARVGKPALYRRYPTKSHLVFAATVHASAPAALPDTGTLRGDLTAVVHGLVAALSATPRAVSADQFATAIRDPAFARTLIDKAHAPTLKMIAGIWDRAILRGEVRADVDGPARLADLSSILVMRVLYFHEPPDAKEIADVVEHFLYGVVANDE